METKVQWIQTLMSDIVENEILNMARHPKYLELKMVKDPCILLFLNEGYAYVYGYSFPSSQLVKQ